jgi:hypothetical protein
MIEFVFIILNLCDYSNHMQCLLVVENLRNYDLQLQSILSFHLIKEIRIAKKAEIKN